MTLYVTVPDFKQTIGIGDTIDDAFILAALDAAGTLIDQYCGRTFAPATGTASARVFDAACCGAYGMPSYGWFYGYAGSSGCDRLYVPDVTSVSSIEIDTARNGTFSATLPAGSWQLYPLNVGQPGVVGNYTQIRLRPNAPYAFWGQVRVTGDWGWPETDPPQPVVLANILLGNRYIRRPNAPFGVWEAPQMGGLATLPQNDPDVAQLLEAYRVRGRAPNWVAV